MRGAQSAIRRMRLILDFGNQPIFSEFHFSRASRPNERRLSRFEIDSRPLEFLIQGRALISKHTTEKEKIRRNCEFKLDSTSPLVLTAAGKSLLLIGKLFFP